jgi:hypothetical protein
MGKKKSNNKDIYEKEQVNKKYRKKSKKLEKREKHRKNKKSTKKEKHKKRQLEKYIKKVFKDNKKEIDLARLPLDLDEICKQVKKLILLNSSAVEEVPEFFKLMEDSKREIDLSELEDKIAQKHIMKLMKQLKVYQNPKNPYAFKIVNLFKQRDPKQKYTTDLEDIVAECLSSYYLLVKAIFEYINYVINSSEAAKQNNEAGDVEMGDSESIGSEESEADGSESQDNNADIEKKQLENEFELEEINNKLGNNAELINKAFNKIINDQNKNTNLDNNNIESEEEELVGPPVPKFLESTMSLLNDTEGFEELFNKNTYAKQKPQVKNNKDTRLNNIEPINKDSYDKLRSLDKERMKLMQESLDEYESKHRGTSLLEMHQMKKSKNNADKRFDREKDMNMVNSKKAVQIISESKGLKGRFEAKEKYMGY